MAGREGPICKPGDLSGLEGSGWTAEGCRWEAGTYRGSLRRGLGEKLGWLGAEPQEHREGGGASPTHGIPGELERPRGAGA